jgi:hypothetical protein
MRSASPCVCHAIRGDAGWLAASQPCWLVVYACVCRRQPHTTCVHADHLHGPARDHCLQRAAGGAVARRHRERLPPREQPDRDRDGWSVRVRPLLLLHGQCAPRVCTQSVFPPHARALTAQALYLRVFRRLVLVAGPSLSSPLSTHKLPRLLRKAMMTRPRS